MFSKSFIASAMLSLVLTATAFGQKEIVVWHGAKDTKNTHRKANIKSTGNEVAVESLDKTKPKGTGKPAKQVVFEPNNEPLWAKAKQTPTAKTRQARTPKGVVVVEVPVNAKEAEGERNKARKKKPSKHFTVPKESL